MTDRLPSSVLAAALIRRVNDAGGFAMVLAKGDADSGQFLLLALARDGSARMFERGFGQAGGAALVDITPADSDAESLDAYWRRRRARDPDLWVIELDIPEAERFAAETLLQH